VCQSLCNLSLNNFEQNGRWKMTSLWCNPTAFLPPPPFTSFWMYFQKSDVSWMVCIEWCDVLMRLLRNQAWQCNACGFVNSNSVKENETCSFWRNGVSQSFANITCPSSPLPPQSNFASQYVFVSWLCTYFYFIPFIHGNISYMQCINMVEYFYVLPCENKHIPTTFKINCRE